MMNSLLDRVRQEILNKKLIYVFQILLLDLELVY